MQSIWTMGEILAEIMRPRADMPLNKPGDFFGPFPSGAPAIFADTVARLGHPAGIIGGVGEDDFGKCVIERLEQDGVNVRLVKRYQGLSTAVAFVTYFSDGSRQFIYHIDRTPAVMTPFSPTDEIESPGFFHLMGCSLMTNDNFRNEIFRAIKWFADQGAKISFDLNIRTELLQNRSLEEVIGPALEHCSVLLPGASELAVLSGKKDVESSAAWLFDHLPALEIAAIKQGRDGCTIFARGEDEPIHVPAYTVEEVDPTGAGDCFDAGFLCGLLENRSLGDCARMGAAAGALNAAAFGPMEGNITPERVKKMTGLL